MSQYRILEDLNNAPESYCSSDIAAMPPCPIFYTEDIGEVYSLQANNNPFSFDQTPGTMLAEIN